MFKILNFDTLHYKLFKKSMKRLYLPGFLKNFTFKIGMAVLFSVCHLLDFIQLLSDIGHCLLKKYEHGQSTFHEK